MTRAPEIRFLVSSPGGLVAPDTSFLNTHLPLSRLEGGNPAQEGPTYSSYLDGMKQLLIGNLERFLEVVAQLSGEIGDVSCCDIIVEKHGSDYHPARLRAYLADAQVSFVANAALTERGAQRLARDFHLLDSLACSFPRKFVPRVDFLIEPPQADVRFRNPVLRMFVGEWLSGYHEFHLTQPQEGDEPDVVVWDQENGHFVLEPHHVEQLFQRAAFILTYYYDVERFREVFPWHHAAGDFVVKVSAEEVDVRLITVRQYRPRVEFPDSGPDNRVTACLIFLANLTMRMRLDRLDGTGEVAWAGGSCVEGTVRGFVEALREQGAEGRCDGGFLRQVFSSIEEMSLTELAELFREVVESYDQDAPDIPVIRENLVEHIFTVGTALVEMLQNG